MIGWLRKFLWPLPEDYEKYENMSSEDTLWEEDEDSFLDSSNQKSDIFTDPTYCFLEGNIYHDLCHDDDHWEDISDDWDLWNDSLSSWDSDW